MKKTFDNMKELFISIDASENAVICKDIHSNIVSWNKGAEKIYGYLEDEVIGKFIDDLVIKNEKDEMLNIIEKIKEGESVKPYLTERIRKDGKVIKVYLTATPLYAEEKIAGILVVERDITNLLDMGSEVMTDENYEKFIKSIPTLAYVKDENLNTVYASNRLCELIGIDYKEASNDYLEKLFGKEKYEMEKRKDSEAIKLELGKVIKSQFDFLIENKEYVFETYRFPLLIHNKKIINCVAIDITKDVKNEKKLKENYEEINSLYKKIRAAEEKLRKQYKALEDSNKMLKKSEERYAIAIEGTNEGIWDVNLREDSVFLSERCKEILEIKDTRNNFSEEEFLNIAYELLDKAIVNTVMKDIREIKVSFSYEFKIGMSESNEKYILFKGKTIFDASEKPTYLAGSISDITESKKSEKMIKKLLYINPVTEIYNRTYAMEEFPFELRKLRKNGQKAFLLFIDLDNFKAVNDTLGHVGGDAFLKEAARRMACFCGIKNNICHLGGDEFVILVTDIKSISGIIKYAENIKAVFNKPFNIMGEEVFYVTISIGIAEFPKDGDNFTELLNHADDAMYNVKKSSKNNYIFYSSSMKSKIYEETKLSSEIKRAISRDEFILYYQPKVSTKYGTINSMEALIRWKKDSGEIISPVQFIPFAEQHGLIDAIERNVIKKACIQNSRWQRMGLKPVRVAVNLSAVQLQRDNITDYIKSILMETGLSPKYFEVEITESMIMKNFDKAIKNLVELQKMGISVSLDDFGTGYSSLNYLRKLPIDSVKIDKSFVDNLTLNSVDKMIAKTVIDLSHGANLNVVAEGVESKNQLELLLNYGCDEIQGYYYSKPLPPEKFYELLKKDPRY